MLAPHELKALAIELAAAMPPETVEYVVTASGVTLSAEAIRIANAYERGSYPQRAALRAIVDSWGVAKESGESR